MTSQKEKNEKRVNEFEKIRTHHESGRTNKPPLELDDFKGKYEVPCTFFYIHIDTSYRPFRIIRLSLLLNLTVAPTLVS